MSQRKTLLNNLLLNRTAGPYPASDTSANAQNNGVPFYHNQRPTRRTTTTKCNM